MRNVIALAALVMLLAPTADAATPYRREVTCPVGGERFGFIDTMSSSSFGARPDGKPYSNWDYPLPQCPGNGLVVYKEFSPQEIERLAELLRSDAFAAVRQRDEPYYIAHWLELHLNPGSNSAVWILLQASWRVDDRPELKTRYQNEFVALVEATTFSDALDGAMARARAANALRELRRFEDAERMRGTISTADLDVPETAPQAEHKRGLLSYVTTLQTLIARRDSSSEPLDAIPRMMAANRCIDHEGEAGWDPDRLCAAEPLAGEVARVRANRARFGG